MLFQRAVPPGPAIAPQDAYTGMDLAARAPADRPYVVCNFVATVDGKATAQGKTALLGGEADRTVFHLLRTQVDAILAGTGTLAVERYGLLVRDAGRAALREAEGRSPQPLAVVISRSGRIPYDIPLFADARARIALYVPPEAEVPGTAAAVVRHELPGPGGGLAAVLRSLRHEHGVGSLLCEGGPALFSAMLADDLVDELFLTVAAVIVGGTELGITTGAALTDMLPVRLVTALEHEGNLFLRYSRR